MFNNKKALYIIYIIVFQALAFVHMEQSILLLELQYSVL